MEGGGAGGEGGGLLFDAEELSVSAIPSNAMQWMADIVTNLALR